MNRLVRLPIVVCLFALPAIAQQWTPYGNFSQQTSYSTSVQPPINADGSSVFPAKKGVIPVHFTLSTGLGPLTIFSNSTAPGYGGVTFTFPAGLTLNTMNYLGFVGTINGCGAGSPRFTLDYTSSQFNPGDMVMYVYLGDGSSSGDPNTGCQNGSGVNLLSGSSAVRFEATSLGDPVQYDTLSGAAQYAGLMEIQGINFVTDNGNSSVTLQSVEIGSTQINFASTATPTCNLPPATLDLTTIAGTSLLGVDETTYTIPADNGYNFRIDGCQYVYNLNAKPLSAGKYMVFVNVGGLGDVQTSPGAFAMQ